MCENRFVIRIVQQNTLIAQTGRFSLSRKHPNRNPLRSCQKFENVTELFIHKWRAKCERSIVITIRLCTPNFRLIHSAAIISSNGFRISIGAHFAEYKIDTFALARLFSTAYNRPRPLRASCILMHIIKCKNCPTSERATDGKKEGAELIDSVTFNRSSSSFSLARFH